MSEATVQVYKEPSLENLLEPGEQVLWTGVPFRGQGLFEPVGQERLIHLSLLVGTVLMWCSLPFIGAESRFGVRDAYWVYGVVSIAFLAISCSLAHQRRYVLSNFLYFVTDERTILCRRAMNWRLSERLYVVSCPLSTTFPYEVVETRPYPSIRVGTLLSEDVVQPFGIGISHPGHSPLWGRITMQVMFDYLEDVEAVRALILQQAAQAEAALAKRG
ncbi:hypothetical protein [Pelagimonas sp. KU-00592-HH]|uniref:hypothetical protein n=1 Tax=Pelagimonas sp. KU-00592-HH TaxID=3127651 RepID=UPI00333FA1A0